MACGGRCKAVFFVCGLHAIACRQAPTDPIRDAAGCAGQRPLLATALFGVVPSLAAPAAVEPRDTQTVIESGVPALPSDVSLEVLGFDSYLRLRASGREVQVPGYENEPYLRIDRDGSVWFNEGSRTWALNTDLIASRSKRASGSSSTMPP